MSRYHPPTAAQRVASHAEAVERVRAFLVAYMRPPTAGRTHVVASIDGHELQAADLDWLLDPPRLPKRGETWETSDCVYRCESDGPDDRGNYAWSDGRRLHLFPADGLTPQD